LNISPLFFQLAKLDPQVCASNGSCKPADRSPPEAGLRAPIWQPVWQLPWNMPHEAENDLSPIVVIAYVLHLSLWNGGTRARRQYWRSAARDHAIVNSFGIVVMRGQRTIRAFQILVSEWPV